MRVEVPTSSSMAVLAADVADAQVTSNPGSDQQNPRLEEGVDHRPHHHRQPPVRKLARRWTEDEIRLLRSILVEANQGRPIVDWPKVHSEMKNAGFERTVFALKKKATELKDPRHIIGTGTGNMESGRVANEEPRVVQVDLTPTVPVRETESVDTNSGSDATMGVLVEAPDPEFLELFNRILRVTHGQPMQLRKAIPTRTKVHETTLRWANEALISQRGEGWSLDRLNQAVYAAAKASTEYTIILRGETAQMSQRKRIAEAQSKISEVRRLAGYLTKEIQRRKEKRKITRKEMVTLRSIRKDLGVRGKTSQLKLKLCDLKLKLKIDSNHLKRLQSDYKRKSIRIKYEMTGGNLSATLPKERSGMAPLKEDEKQELIRFWKSVFGEKRRFLRTSDLDDFVKRVTGENTEPDELQMEEIRRLVSCAIAKIRPWKSPGNDKIQAYWWKTFPEARKGLEVTIGRILTGNSEGKNIPRWLTEGKTVLIPKKENPQISEYRPIACLNTQYKIITSVVALALYNRFEHNELLFPREQLALRQGQRGCLNAHLMDQAVQLDVMHRKKSKSSGLATAWIDFKKAFDSISHEYMEFLIDSVGIPKGIRNFLKAGMAGWRTTLTLNGEKVGAIRVRSGVYQGDSLSPLLFCLAISPISDLLKRRVDPYVSSGRKFYISHTYYVDDLKLYTHTRAAMTQALEIVQRFSDSIGLELNAKKSAVHLFNVPGEQGAIADIPTLQEDYAYLGIKQTLRTSVRSVLADCRGRIEAKTREILEAPDLSAGQRIRSLNTVVLPIAQYIFTHSQVGQRFECAIRFAKDLDISMRRELSKTKMRYAHVPIERYYMAREDGGLGLVSFEEILMSSTLDAAAYLSTNRHVSGYRTGFWTLADRGKRTLIADARRVLAEMPIRVCFNNGEVIVDDVSYTSGKCSQHLRTLVRQAFRSRARGGWCDTVAKKFDHIEDISREASDRWIAKGAMSCENLRLALGVREGNILIASGIQKRPCPACGKATESISHVSSNCESYRMTLMIERHDAVARVIYDHLKTVYGFDSTHYSEAIDPELVNAKARLLWNVKLRTNQEIYHRQPDLVLFVKDQGKVERIVILEVAVSDPKALPHQIEIKRNRYCVNGELQEEEEKVPYKPSRNLTRDLENQYSVKVEFIPIVVSTTGHIPMSLIEDLKTKLKIGERDRTWITERLGRAAALGTARLWKVHLARANA